MLSLPPPPATPRRDNTYTYHQRSVIFIQRKWKTLLDERTSLGQSSSNDKQYITKADTQSRSRSRTETTLTLQYNKIQIIFAPHILFLFSSHYTCILLARSQQSTILNTVPANRFLRFSIFLFSFSQDELKIACTHLLQTCN